MDYTMEMAPPPFLPDRGSTLMVHTDPDMLDNVMPSHAIFGAESTPAVSLHVAHPNEQATLGMGGPPVPSATKKQGVKRKAQEMDLLTGKQLVDTYAKRSWTLLEKGKELAQLTGAYVFIFTARPESIELGNHRLYTSQNLEHAQSAPLRSLSGVASEIKDTLDAKAGMRRRRHHYAEVDDSLSTMRPPDIFPPMSQTAPTDLMLMTSASAAVFPHSGVALPPDSGIASAILVPSLGLEPAVLPPSLGLEPAALPPTSGLGLVHPADPNIVDPLDRTVIPDGSCRETQAMANPIAGPMSSPGFVNAARTTALSLERETLDIISIVDQLKGSKARDICALDAIRVFVSSHYDAQALRAAKVIPHLTSFLNAFAYVPIELDVPCRVALILSRMLHDRKSCKEMLEAGITFSLGHLLSHPVSDEVQVAVANVMGRCACSISESEFPEKPWHYFPAVVLQPLIGLLSSTSMEVRLASAEALRNISMQNEVDDNPIAECLAHEGALRRFCDLALCCRNLAEMELVLRAIVHLSSTMTMNNEDIEMIQGHILQPLLTRSRSQDCESQVAVCRALQTLSKVPSFRRQFARTMVIPQAKLWCSSDDDEIFIEGVCVAAAWATVDCGQYIGMFHIRRLIGLLSDNKDRLVERACWCLGKLTLHLPAIFEEMENLDGPRRLMEILFERPVNPRLWDAVWKVFYFFSDDHAFKTSLTEQGLISALTRCLSFDFGPYRAVEGLCDIMRQLLDEWEGATVSFLNAGVIGRLTSLLSSPECTAVPPLSYTLSFLVLQPETSPGLLLREGAIRPFMRSVSLVLEDRDGEASKWSPICAIAAIVHVIDRSPASRAEFRAAGVEDILKGYLPECSPGSKLGVGISSTLRLLRSDVERTLECA